MKYTPEKYEFDICDVVIFTDRNNIAYRWKHNEWKSFDDKAEKGVCYWTDDHIIHFLKHNCCKYAGNRFGNREE